jgi:hypothetical protein
MSSARNAARSRGKYDQRQLTKRDVDALCLKPTDLVGTKVAAVVVGVHPVTMATWRGEGRGPPYVQDPECRVVRYSVGKLWAYAEKHTIDPSNTDWRVQVPLR